MTRTHFAIARTPYRDGDSFVVTGPKPVLEDVAEAGGELEVSLDADRRTLEYQLPDDVDLSQYER